MTDPDRLFYVILEGEKIICPAVVGGKDKMSEENSWLASFVLFCFVFFVGHYSSPSEDPSYVEYNKCGLNCYKYSVTCR